MNGDLYFDGKKYISSSRAAKISGYANDYIGQLCRDGKLDARMVGRSWYVGLESLIQHKSSNLVGTRSRGPKNIKSLIAEIERSEVSASPKIEPEGLLNFSPVTLPREESIPQAISHSVNVRVLQTPNISYPVFSASSVNIKISESKPVSMASEVEISREVNVKGFGFKLKTATALVGILFAILGFRFGLSLSPVAEAQYATLWGNVSSSLEASVLSSVGDTARAKVVAFYNTLRNWISGDKQTVFVMSDAEPTTNQVVPQDNATLPKEGLVVVPTDENTDRAAVIAKVKSTFSDEVSVSPTAGDNESGVITPVFKKSKGDDYLYVLVPITN